MYTQVRLEVLLKIKSVKESEINFMVYEISSPTRMYVLVTFSAALFIYLCGPVSSYGEIYACHGSTHYFVCNTTITNFTGKPFGEHFIQMRWNNDSRFNTTVRQYSTLLCTSGEHGGNINDYYHSDQVKLNSACQIIDDISRLLSYHTIKVSGDANFTDVGDTNQLVVACWQNNVDDTIKKLMFEGTPVAPTIQCNILNSTNLMRISLEYSGNVSSVDYFDMSYCGTGVKIHPQRTSWYVELDEGCNNRSDGVINVTVTAVNHCQVPSEMDFTICNWTDSTPINSIHKAISSALDNTTTSLPTTSSSLAHSVQTLPTPSSLAHSVQTLPTPSSLSHSVQTLPLHSALVSLVIIASTNLYS